MLLRHLAVLLSDWLRHLPLQLLEFFLHPVQLLISLPQHHVRMLPAAQWRAQIDPVVDDSALRQRPLYFHPLVLFYGGVGRVVVVEGGSGLVNHVVILDDVVLHLGRQLVELSDGDAHVQTSEDVAQIFITVHSVVLGVHRPAQYSGGLSLLLLLLHFQLGFGMAVVILSNIFRIAELVQVVGSRS